jgi:hypothetical protein
MQNLSISLFFQKKCLPNPMFIAHSKIVVKGKLDRRCDFSALLSLSTSLAQLIGHRCGRGSHLLSALLSVLVFAIPYGLWVGLLEFCSKVIRSIKRCTSAAKTICRLLSAGKWNYFLRTSASPFRSRFVKYNKIVCHLLWLLQNTSTAPPSWAD